MSATKQENGTWFARVYYSDITGKRYQKGKRGFKTKREALEWEREFLLKTEFSTDMKFKSLYELYLEDMKTRIRAVSILNKEYIVKRLILPYFSEMPLKNITPLVIRSFQNELINMRNSKNNEEYSPTYAKMVYIHLSSILNYAVKYHNLKENPCKKAGTVGRARSNKEMEYWTLEEFNKFIKHIGDNPTLNLGFKILFWTGCRIGELLALTVGDIDLQRKTIDINKSLQRLKGTDIITAPKTPKSIREVDITDDLVEELRAYFKKLYYPTSETRIVTSLRGNFANAIKTHSKKADIKYIRIHDLRHSHASLLIHLGANPLAISRRLGHENIETTLNTYSHLYPEAYSDIMKKMNKL